MNSQITVGVSARLVPIPDLVTAVAPESARLTLLHDDADFERIAVAIFEAIGARPAIARTMGAHADALLLAGRPVEAQRQREAAQDLLAELGIHGHQDAI